MSTSHHGTLVITAADYYTGFHTTHQILRHYRAYFDKCIVTCVHPDRCEPLGKMGAEVIKINPNDEQTYQKAFTDAHWILFFPEPESGRVQAANRAIDAMKKANVKHVLLISIDSADSKDLRYIAEYKEIEDKLRATITNHIIFRCSLFQNCFHLNAPYVKKHRAFPMTTPEHTELVPVELDDVTMASLAVIKDGIEKHRSEVYVLTGPKKITGHQVAEELNRAVEGGKDKIQYKQLSHSEMEEYLKCLKDHIGDDDHDELLKHEFKGQPTEHQIKTYLDEMEWLKSGHAKKTEDLKKLTGHEGHDLEHFFGNHKGEFTPTH